MIASLTKKGTLIKYFADIQVHHSNRLKTVQKTNLLIQINKSKY